MHWFKTRSLLGWVLEMELLRLLAWLIALVVVLGLAFSLMPSWENWSASSPWSGFITAPGLKRTQTCPASNTSINPEPWDLYNSRWFNLSRATTAVELHGPGRVLQALRFSNRPRSRRACMRLHRLHRVRAHQLPKSGETRRA